MKGLVVRKNRIIIETDLELPGVKPGHVLVKVFCASVNPSDADIVEGKYDKWLKFLGKHDPVKSGLEFSGIVEETATTRFKKGDRVFGYVDFIKGPKSHQEYLLVHGDYMAVMPADVDFEQAAGIPLGALTSLVALEDKGSVTGDSTVLINGACGGLGVYAVQIAKIFGARITAVAGPGQGDFLSDLGADIVIDYRQTDVKALKQEFDLIFDLTTNLRFNQIKGILSKKGRFIPADPMKNALDFLINPACSKKTKYLFVQYGNHEKLARIAKWVEQGRLIPQIDMVFSFSEFNQAFDRISQKGRKGRTVLSLVE